MRVEPVQRRSGGPLLEHRHRAEVVCDEMQSAIEFGNPSGCRAVGRTHLRDQEAAVLGRQEVVSNARFDGFGGEQKPRIGRIGHVKEEDPVLPLQQAQQSPASQNGFRRIQVAVVRFVADVAGRWKRYGLDHRAISRRLLVKIDHCQEIRCDVSLVLRPDVENFVFSPAMAEIAGPHDTRHADR